MSTMTPPNPFVTVVGGGLAGSECAYQLAERGHKVVLIEMRGSGRSTPAHKTDRFAELVCSNSLGSTTDYSAPGQLKWEAQRKNSLILAAASMAAVPAGMALGVDREVFAAHVTETLKNHPNITIKRETVSSLEEIPRPCVIATGPLTDEALAKSIGEHLGEEFLYFYDAIAPIIDVDSINFDKVFKADRFDRGTKDYINCGLQKDEYFRLIEEIKAAKKVEFKEFERVPYFSGCMPIEAMIETGDQTLRFGPLSPKGITHPETKEKYYAVVQLRQDNKEATAYNMVGFQTKMAYADQKRVFRMIPGLEEAEFLKLGSIHKNMFIHSPKKLTRCLSSQTDPWLFFAGQITGVEGYFDSTCIGLLVAGFLEDRLQGRDVVYPPRASAFGSLLNGITEDNDYFQPTNINFGLFPKPPELPSEGKKKKEGKKERRDRQLELAKEAFLTWDQP